MSKHTPGPWVVQWQFFGGGNQRREVANTKDHRVATIDTFISNPGQSYEEAVEANARLISAAPELLEVARKVDALFLELTAEQKGSKLKRATDWGVVNQILLDAKAAIRKAEGGE